MIQSVRGTKDILPETMAQWHFVEQKFREVSSLFCYEELRTPIFEKTEVFNRSIGEETDIVNKEMYTFTDKGGESLTLRPEMTAALVRSLIQNNMMAQSPIQKLWYFGPFFRYERPQKGRLRQFHQYGAECIGSQYPESDAEILMLADTLFKNVGITNYNLLINSLGNSFSRKQYKDALVVFLNKIKDELSHDSKNRIEKNPLRVLDSKDENDIRLLVDAPLIEDSYDDESKNHFIELQNVLNELQIPFTINPKLVRGLDYYSHTVFEFQSNYLGSQDSFGGGGRYDGLISQLGGKETPAVGFALGVERLLIILEQLKAFENLAKKPEVSIIVLGEKNLPYSLKISKILRDRNMAVIVDLNRRSMKSQMRDANRVESRYAIIIGDNEFAGNKAIIKNLTNSEQSEIDFSELINFNF